jgi:predicted unusual protein kinase regulating ubiquinone biosynthesis (AarF/ABC1/UbiB family)
LHAPSPGLKNLLLFLSPGRVQNDWVYIKDQMEDLRLRLETEVDYRQEAATQEKARMLFRNQDGIVVPKVYPKLSTDRVLTMDYLEGIHLEEFLQSNPSQEQRNEAGRKITRAWYRLFAAGPVCCMLIFIQAISCFSLMAESD